MAGKGKSKNQPQSPCTVTLLNADPEAGEIMARVLESTGDQVVRAFDDQADLAAVTSDIPSLVVIDLGGGASNPGLRVVEELRSHPNDSIRSLRVILISNQARAESLAWSAGVDGYLERPVKAADVTATVAEVMARPDKERVAFRRERQGAH